MATAEALPTALDAGTLANNYMFVRGLQSALSSTETNVNAVINSLKTVIGENCWRQWVTMEGKEVRWNAADFRRFIEAPRPMGCQVSIAFVRELIRESAIAEQFEEMIRGERGSGPGGNNPTGNNQYSEVNRDNITVNLPDTIPLSPAVPRPRVRDYSREAPTGTSVSYTLRRLSKSRPDLHEKVRNGELTPSAAAIQAGFRKPTITLPVDSEAAARLIVKHFQGDALADLIRGLANWAGIEIVEPSS